MRPEDLPAEVRAFADMAIEHLAAIRDDLLQGAVFYMDAVGGLESREDMIRWLERLAARGHDDDEYARGGIEEQWGYSVMTPEARRLHTLLASSLVLMLSQDEDARSAMLTIDEVSDRINAPEVIGRWEGRTAAQIERDAVEIDRDFVAQRAAAAMAGLDEDVPVRSEVEAALEDQLFETAKRAAIAYYELAPDGRELSADERAVAVRHMEAAALGLVEAERQRDVLERLHLTVGRAGLLKLLRMLLQGFAMALSADPDTRSRALSTYYLAEFVRPTRPAWNAWVQADRSSSEHESVSAPSRRLGWVSRRWGRKT